MLAVAAAKILALPLNGKNQRSRYIQSKDTRFIMQLNWIIKSLNTLFS